MTYGSVITISTVVFLVGLLGVFRQTSIIKTIIAIEIMVLASVANFCVFSGKLQVTEGHFVAILITLISGVTVSVLYAIYATTRHENDTELLTEND